MENRYENQNCRPAHERKSGGSFLGTILIVIGVLWILKEIGWHVGLPGWQSMQQAGSNLMNLFHFGAISISWPVIILIAGLLVLAGRRVIGGLLVCLAVFLILPHFVIIPGILALLFFPVILLVLGIILISKIL
ncbi:hypothetical protein [Sunxiuqinia dokdonensis]|uniref:Uncharacterized protein n=1 Tax=Sunxiuqinia dokdonensis TaxID=1409788 RepID=A0A0L8VA29_9BACT|nr:hypothetical protein [Sunxiuqinia dokdonensis]KOH45289.1 hypothetical protein NC99_18970 [Sunxiuqinia dokdonensis]